MMSDASKINIYRWERSDDVIFLIKANLSGYFGDNDNHFLKIYLSNALFFEFGYVPWLYCEFCYVKHIL